jgi:hypothetical protein
MMRSYACGQIFAAQGAVTHVSPAVVGFAADRTDVNLGVGMLVHGREPSSGVCSASNRAECRHTRRVSPARVPFHLLEEDHRIGASRSPLAPFVRRLGDDVARDDLKVVLAKARHRRRAS